MKIQFLSDISECTSKCVPASPKKKPYLSSVDKQLQYLYFIFLCEQKWIKYLTLKQVAKKRAGAECRKTQIILCTKGNSLKQYGTSIQQSWTERKATVTLQILDTLYLHHAYCADFTIQSSCCHSLNPRQSTAISNYFSFFLLLKKLRHTHMVFTLLLFR